MVPRAKVPAPRLDDWTSTVNAWTFTIVYRTSTFSTGSGIVGIGEKVDGVVAAAVLGRSGGTSRVWLVTTPLVIRTALPNRPLIFPLSLQ